MIAVQILSLVTRRSYFLGREKLWLFFLAWSGTEGHILSVKHLLRAHLSSPGRYYPPLHSEEFADLVPF